MNSLFIYNAEAETAVQLHFCSLTASMKKRASEDTKKLLFDDLLHSTFQLRSDLIPSDYKGRQKAIDNCVGPANKLAYALANGEDQEPIIADKVFWREDAQKALQEIYQKGVTKAAQNKIVDEGNVIIISLVLVRYPDEPAPDIQDETYRCITVKAIKDNQENYDKYHGIGFVESEFAVESMEKLLNESTPH